MAASTATATTAGTNTPATRSASAWIGARLRCAFAIEGNDAGERGLGADPLRPHHEATGPGERAAGERIAGSFLHRQRLAGDHALVEGGAALGDDPIYRHALAGPHPQPVAGADSVEGHVGLALFFQSARRFRCEAHERADGIARPLTGNRFHHLTD